MRFRREIHNGRRTMLSQQCQHQLPIRNVSFDESMGVVTEDSLEGIQIARIRQLVERQCLALLIQHAPPHKRGADESGPASHQPQIAIQRRHGV
jgi:hypothetical protein